MHTDTLRAFFFSSTQKRAVTIVAYVTAKTTDSAYTRKKQKHIRQRKAFKFQVIRSNNMSSK